MSHGIHSLSIALSGAENEVSDGAYGCGRVVVSSHVPAAMRNKVFGSSFLHL